jgi:predicted ester cyclase
MEITVDDARAIVEPLYDGMNRLGTLNIEALLDQCMTPDFQTCANEGECIGVSDLIGRWKNTAKTVPDLSWSIRDVMVSGNKIIVRGEARGTPVDTFRGLAPTGRSFRIMSIDIHTVRDGKIAQTYHIENWEGALRQLKGG